MLGINLDKELILIKDYKILGFDRGKEQVQRVIGPVQRVIQIGITRH